LPNQIGWVAVAAYVVAVICGFYAIYHVVFLKFRMDR